MSQALALVDDLLFLSRIREAARGTGIEVRAVRRAADLVEAARAGAPARARGRRLRPPALERRPSPPCAPTRPSRTCRVVAFLSHVHADRAEAARAAGCSRVLARGAFVQELPRLLAAAAPPDTVLEEPNLEPKRSAPGRSSLPPSPRPAAAREPRRRRPPPRRPAPAGGLRPLSSREAGAPAAAGARRVDPAAGPSPDRGRPGRRRHAARPSPRATRPTTGPMRCPGEVGGHHRGDDRARADAAGQVAASDVLYVMAKKGKATLAVRRVDKPSRSRSRSRSPAATR